MSQTFQRKGARNCLTQRRLDAISFYILRLCVLASLRCAFFASLRLCVESFFALWRYSPSTLTVVTLVVGVFATGSSSEQVTMLVGVSAK